jgi:hypothetical protein
VSRGGMVLPLATVLSLVAMLTGCFAFGESSRTYVPTVSVTRGDVVGSWQDEVGDAVVDFTADWPVQGDRHR